MKYSFGWKEYKDPTFWGTLIVLSFGVRIGVRNGMRGLFSLTKPAMIHLWKTLKSLAWGDQLTWNR